MIGELDLHRAIVANWQAGSLDGQFSPYWSNGSGHALNDTEAMKGQEFPYCVLDMGAFVVTDKMTGHSATERHWIYDVPVTFNVFANTVSGTSAKQLAGNLAEEIMKIFGGHPTQAPLAVTLTQGNHLITQLQSEFGVKLGDQEHNWMINYNFKLDLPIAV